MQFDWAKEDLREFCGEVLEDANDHFIALAIWSMNLSDVDLACDFLRLEEAIAREGGTREMLDRRNELLDRFGELRNKAR